MIDLKNDEVLELINRILDDPEDTIHVDMLRDLSDKLNR